MKRDLKTKVYADLAKIREHIAKLPDGKDRAKALHIWYVLNEILGADKHAPKV